MTTFVVPNFQGIAPRFADRLLEAEQASFVANLKATNGNLRGFRSLQRIAAFSPTGHIYRRAIKFYYPGSDDFEWFLSDDVNADAVQNPLASDGFNRIYYTEAGQPNMQVTTLAWLESGAPSVSAGVPRPTSAPGVSPSGGTGVTRAYVYTWQTDFGSEGAPSPPTIGSGGAGTWNISFTVPPAGTTKTNIYRSASGAQSSGQYYLVGTVASPGTALADTMADNLVPLQPPLLTYDNDVPPAGLYGLVQHSSGAFAGFIDRTVYFSVPYLPHAWPQSWTYTVESEIVGLAAILNYIVVLTKGHPFILSGTHPSLMGPIRLPDPEPCTAKRSIVVMDNAALFTSPNGLCSISQQGLTRPTNPLMTRDEFAIYEPSNIVANVYGSFYIGFYNDSRGFAISLPPYEPIQFVPLDRYSNVTGLDTDHKTGDLIVTCGDTAHLFDAVHDLRFATTFRTKEFIATYPINLGAVQILFKPDLDRAQLDALIAAAEAYNEVRFAEGELDVLNGYPINGSIDEDFSPSNTILAGLPPIQPVGGEPLYSLTQLDAAGSVNFVLIADSRVRHIKLITSERVYKLPEGYKATRFYAEISGAVEVERIILAETAKECRSA